MREIGNAVREINDVTSNIAGAINQQDAATREISANAQLAAQGNETLVINIGSLSEAMGKTSTAAESVLSASSELTAMAETLSREGILYSHASPVSDMASFLPEPAEDERELIGGSTERRLVFGHTHLQFRREGPGGVDLVNPGSVGLPFDGDTRAAYALVSDEGELELRRVEYDHERVAALIRERMPGFGDDLAARIDTARPPA